eukprot:COSAG02_NODE_29252_length_573_cov_0.751055_1_plen_150_part_01
MIRAAVLAGGLCGVAAASPGPGECWDEFDRLGKRHEISKCCVSGDKTTPMVWCVRERCRQMIVALLPRAPAPHSQLRRCACRAESCVTGAFADIHCASGCGAVASTYDASTNDLCCTRECCAAPRARGHGQCPEFSLGEFPKTDGIDSCQ